MALHRDDIENDPTDTEQDAIELIEGFGVDETIDIILILGQLDPTEVSDGQPRWTPDQIALITKAKDKLTAWQE